MSYQHFIKISLCFLIGLFGFETAFAQGKKAKTVVQIKFDEKDAKKHKPLAKAQDKAEAKDAKPVKVDKAPNVVPFGYANSPNENEVEPLSPKQKEQMKRASEKAREEERRAEEERADREARAEQRHKRELASVAQKPVLVDQLLKKFQRQMAEQTRDYDE